MEKPLITNSKNRIDQIRRRGTGEQAYCATHTRAILSTRPFLRAAICRGGRDRGAARDGLPRRTLDLGCGRPKALTTEFCPMNNSATRFRHICWFAICCCRRKRRCNVCHVTWTGLKRPTETPCHYYGITSKIPLQWWSMGWLWDGYSVHE